MNVGVDVGGTFTDVIAHLRDGGPPRVRKVPTTRDPSRALLDGLDALRAGADVARLTYGTTVVTNALVEGRGARVGLVTTRGFRDVLEIARQQRDHLYRLDVPGRTPPAVPRALRFEVTERVDHEGRVLTPLDEADIAGVADALRREGVEAVAVSLLHAYANPAHERRLGALLAPHVPYVCLSSDVNPEFREYERTHTTCVNTQLMPLVDRYLDDLVAGLAAAGVRAPLHVMQSSGGMASPDRMRQTPLAMLMSGPAGGVAAARAVGAHAGVTDAVTLDMGGTSADVCLIRDGGVATVSQRRVQGQPVRLRSLAVESIGAGGGSIAWRDRAGALRVGPQSAGADPGPACYGHGGAQPTVTDAYVVLGYLNPEEEIGGLRLDPNRAAAAIESIGARYGLAAPEAAAGIVEIANAAMLRAIRLVSLQRGFDPRRLTLIAYGGAGPVHAGRLAVLAGMPRVLVPPHSGVFSACGCLLADLRYDAARTVRAQLARDAPEVWEAPLRDLEAELLARFADDGVPPGDVVLRRSMDLRYSGQNYEIEVPVAAGLDEAAIARRFSQAHRREYEYATEEPVEAVTVRVAAVAPSPEAILPAASSAPRRGPKIRRAFFYQTGWAEAVVCGRHELDVGSAVPGPAIVEDEWSTVVVYPGQTVRRDALDLLWIEGT
ncbi:MAG TPA: hydantoinase/oxoprolinase family protein [bacterium]|nr:hydantoinase/oxoprolinase family protein [bacterium]